MSFDKYLNSLKIILKKIKFFMLTSDALKNSVQHLKRKSDAKFVDTKTTFAHV